MMDITELIKAKKQLENDLLLAIQNRIIDFARYTGTQASSISVSMIDVSHLDGTKEIWAHKVKVDIDLDTIKSKPPHQPQSPGNTPPAADSNPGAR